MTVTTTIRERRTACDGVTTAFALGFQVTQPGDLVVRLVDDATQAAAVLTEGTHYVLSGDLRAGLATVTTLAAYPAGKTLWRRRETASQQLADYVPNDGFPAEAHEGQLDRLTFVDQEIASDVARAVLAPPGEPGLTLRPNALATGGVVIGRNASTGALQELSLDDIQGNPGGAGINVVSLQAIAGLVIPTGTNALLLNDGDRVIAATVSPSDVASFPRTMVRDASPMPRGFQRHIVRQEGLRPAIWLPGTAPVNSSQAADQTAGFDEMIRWGIKTMDRGVIIVGEPGAVYTSENGYCLNGLRSLWFRGNGCILQNGWFGSTADAGMGLAANRQAPSPTNNPATPNGRELITYATGQTGGNDFGVKIATAAKGQTYVDAVGGATFRGPGPALIGSNARYQQGGLPASYPTFEYNYIVSLSNGGTRANLLTPLSQDYERYGPLVNFNPGGTNPDQSGFAACVELERPNGTRRRSVWPDETIFEDVEWRPNPNWVQADPGHYYPNNQVYFGGGKLAVLRRCKMIDLGIGSARKIIVDDGDATGVLEIDKSFDDLELGGRFNQIQGGTGGKRVKLRRGRTTGRFGAGPIELLDIDDWRFEGRAIDSDVAMLSTMGCGPRKVRIGDNVTFVPFSDTDRMLYKGALSAGVLVTDQTEIYLTRSGWEASGWGQALYPGAVLLRTDNTEAFRVDRMQHCDTSGTPNPDARSANVYIGGQTIGAALSSGVTLKLPLLPDLGIGDFKVEGPYAKRLTYATGVKQDNFNAQSGKGSWPGFRDGKLTFTDRDCLINDNANAYGFGVPRPQRVVRIDMEVMTIVAATQLLAITVDYANGTTFVATLSVDLHTIGQRRWVIGGSMNVLGADVATAFPSEPILQVRVTNPAAANANGAKGKFRVTFWCEDAA